MNNNDKSIAWRDVVLNRLDYHCTRFNRRWKRGEAWFKGIMPHLAVAVVLLFLWNEVVSIGLHAWCMQHPAWVYFLNRHDGWAYAYSIGLFVVLPLFFSITLTMAVFRLVHAMQSRRQKRISSKTWR